MSPAPPPGEQTGSRSWFAPLLAIGAAVLAIVVVAAVAIIGGSSGQDGDAPSAATTRPAATGSASNAKVPLGVFRQTNAREVAGFERWLGARVDLAVDFSSRRTWNDIARPDYLLEEWQKTKYRLVYAVPMLPDEQQASMEVGAKGDYDRYYRTLAEGLVARGQQDAILRIGWEFNLESWPWSIADELTFKTYFRSIVAAMRSVPGQKFKIDWNVNNGHNAYDAVWYYPGNDVVDYIGVDAYDVSGAVYPYPANCNAACRTSTQKKAWDEQIYGGERGLKFWSGFAADHGKEMSLPEWGLWDRPDGTGGGDDPYFIQRMHEFMTDPANKVAYQAYFEFNGDNGSHSLRESFPAGAAQYRRLFSTP